MTDYRALLSAPPLSDRLCVTDLFGAAKFLDKVDRVFVSSEDMSVYKTLKELLPTAPLCYELPLSFFSGGGCDLPSGKFAAVMSNEKLRVLKERTKPSDFAVAIPSDLDFAWAFSGVKIRLGEFGYFIEKNADLFKVVIPLGIGRQIRSGALADAFCAAAAVVFDEFSKYVFDIINNTDITGAQADISPVIDVLLNARSGEEASAVFKAQIALSYYFSKKDKPSDHEITAKILKKLGVNASESECGYCAAKYIFRLLSAANENGIKNNTLFPRYVERLQTFTALLKAYPDALTKNYLPLSEEETFAFFDAVEKSERFKTVAADTAEKITRLDGVYRAIYGGRKKRAEITYDFMRRAVGFSALLSGGVLKYLGDSGITDAL